MIWDYRKADLPSEDRALCDYAVKLTLTPGNMAEADVETLRTHGLSDEAISIATQVISYFNYINRIADGLGVDHDSWMAVPKEKWLTDKGYEYEDVIG